ncbi:MAG: aminoacyl-histidine dipeptidase [Aquabacterium sp.]|uniref:aminoacyl-histidine dipeptidase n=1 Tax=Aquabacterium sp. TaxID=1872578 RepID=UPI002A363721|nr:aminoacyl-histidine dipeptidase [Aquabacterium sp.]MDX9843536.1 aminoacyl-histidine dipeptidase [Aquabacterium sp.]
MTPVFASLQPAAVWRHFDTLCRIPRPSKQEAALRSHLAQWAQAQGLSHEVDAVGNLLVRKPASPGCAHRPGVVLQGHLDMVCQANSGVTHDFSRDPITPVLQDGWLRAEGTTLGADNGIGVALALAALEDRTLVHGPLEVLFTVDEEAGMGGAQGLASDVLQGSLMLNLDTEEWGEFYLGCAGGLDVNVDRPACAEEMPAGHGHRRIALQGLRGGHSGIHIHEERGNAIKLLVRVLHALAPACGLRLVSLQGGTARNALPREAFAIVALPPDQLPALDAQLAAWQTMLRQEWGEVEPGLSLQSQEIGTAEALPAGVLPLHEQAIWLNSLLAAPHGVKRQSLSVAGVVETSNNLGMVNLSPQGGHCNFMVRSLRDSQALALAQEIVSLWQLSGTTAVCAGAYPGWTPRPDSALLRTCQQVFAREFEQASHVQVIHAGLECGLISAKYPDMDIVSFGPTIRGAHAPGESVDVASVARCWQLLVAILQELGAPAAA